MSDVEIPEGLEIVQAPNALVVGWDVAKTQLTGNKGEARSVVVLSLEFQAGPAMMVQQSFIIPKAIAHEIRQGFKHPRQLTTEPSTEETN